MTDDLLYNLTITVENNAEIERVEDKLEKLLFDLYDVDAVVEILVKDRTPPIDEDMDEMLAVIEDINSKEIRRAMDLVIEMERMSDE